MRVIKTLAPCLAILALATTATAQVSLKAKFRENESYTTKAQMRLEQSLVIAGMDTRSSVQNETVVESSVGKRDDSGNISVTSQIKSMQINISAAGSDYSFDSENPDQAGNSPLEMVRPAHKALLKIPAIIVYDQNSKVVSAKRDQSILAGLDVQLQGLVKDEVDPATLKRAAEDELQRLPDDPVKPGDTWTRNEKVNFGGGQVMEFETVYKYEGTVQENGKKLHKITSSTKSVDFYLSDDSPLPLKVSNSDLKPKDSTSVYLFDQALGQIVNAKEKGHVVGELTFEINGMELPAKLDLSIHSESEVSE